VESIAFQMLFPATMYRCYDPDNHEALSCNSNEDFRHVLGPHLKSSSQPQCVGHGVHCRVCNWQNY
jgi:hypothetical protein